MQALPTKRELIALLPYLTWRERAEMDALLAVAGATPPEANNFTAFKRAMWRNYQHAAHLALIDEALMEVARYVETGGAEGIGKLAIFLPPRHGKSKTAAQLFPAWFLGRNPDMRVILTGYAGNLVHKYSRVARNFVLSGMYAPLFPGVRVADDSAARDAWDIADHDGGMDAMGIEGGVAGKGAHVLIIDDAHKNRKEAESKTIRESVWEAYINDLYPRLEPSGAVVLIMTRWHVDDLAGRLLAEEGDEWHVIRLPALAEPGDPLGRAEGEALWAERFPVSALEKHRAHGIYTFESLYQQSPKPREGSLFKYEWIDDRRVERAPDMRRIVVAIDPSASEGGDETGVVVAGATVGKEAQGFILEDGSLRGSPNEWARRAIALYDKWKADAIVIETNQGGDMATNTLRTIRPGVKIREVKATTGKALRADPIAALYEQGRVHHVGEFAVLEDQMVGWTPNDRESPDRLDALVWALTDLMVNKIGVGLR